MPSDDSLLNELDDAIEILTIARALHSRMFIKGVVRYVKAMAPGDVRSKFKESRQ